MARCLIVLADGLRPDAITTTHAPSLTALSRDYTSAHAMTVRPSVTVAALASFATGVSPRTHGLVEPGLRFLPRLADLRPLAKELRAHRISTTVVAGSIGLRDRPIAWALTACAGVDRLISAGRTASSIAHVARGIVNAEEHCLVFAYLPDCDKAGHAHGWMTSSYLRAVSAVDAAIGSLTSVLGDTLLVVLADHGGGGGDPRDHDHPHPLNDHIPLVFAGPGVRRRHGIAGTASLLDVPPTILQWFGVPVPDCYEGRPLVEAFAPPPALAIA